MIREQEKKENVEEEGREGLENKGEGIGLIRF